MKAPSGLAGPSSSGCTASASVVVGNRSLGAVAVGPGDGAEPVVAFEHGPSTLAEHLDASQARPRQHVVPDRRERADRTGLEAERHRHCILDAGDAMKRSRARRDDLDAADEELEHVDVVHRVLEERARSGLLDVTSPGRRVVALDRDELVVSKHDAHHRAGLGSRDDVPEPEERGRASQHETDLIGHSRSGDRLGHRSGARLGGRERLLAEDREPSRGGRIDEPRMLGRPGADVDRVAAVEHLVLRAADLVARRRAELRESIRIEVVRAAPYHVRTTAAERLRVVGGDEACADEADAQRTGLSRGHGGRRYATPTKPATKSFAGCATTSSGVPTCSMRPARMTTS